MPKKPNRARPVGRTSTNSDRRDAEDAGLEADFFFDADPSKWEGGWSGGGHTGSPNGSGRGGWDFFKYWFTQRVLSTGSPNRSWGRVRFLS